MSISRVLKVTSHVGRDLLHAAAAFKTEAAVIWEYVVNTLQYVDRGTTPVVNVLINQKGKVITVSDNGRGMDAVLPSSTTSPCMVRTLSDGRARPVEANSAQEKALPLE